MVYFPNSQLTNMSIVNVRRSPPMSDSVKIVVDFGVPRSTIDTLGSNMKLFVEKNPKKFLPKSSLEMMEIGANGSVTYEFSIDHVSNWQDGTKRSASRNAFLFQLKEEMENLKIKFVVLPLMVMQ